MALTDSPEESITAPVALVPSLYGILLFISAGLLAWLSYTYSKNFAPSPPDNGSSLRVPVQAQPTSATKPKRICIRIAGIPSAWSDFEIRNTLQTFDADFDPETRVSMFPACFGDTQVAICELDSCAGIARQVPPTEPLYIPVSVNGRSIYLSIDKHFYDLTPLNAPKGEIVADVVAVTGLAGHAFGSWRSRKTSQMWLKDLLPEDVRRIRVMIFGYNSNLVGDTVGDRFLEYRKGFIQSLLNARQACENRRIIFIGHSMGGILILQALLQSKNGGQYRRLFDATRSIYFFATPHQGMEVKQLLAMIENESDEVSRRAEFVRQLAQGSSFLDTQREDIMGLWNSNAKIKVVSFYETRKTATVGKTDLGTWSRTGKEIEMVSKGSAQLFWPFEHRIPVSANHTDIVKFPSREDPTYCTLIRYMNDHVEIISKEPATLNNDMFKDITDKSSLIQQDNIPFMVPYSPNKLFVGQEESRDALDRALGLDDGHRRLGIWGLGGVGKSQAVLDYVYQFRYRKSVFWIHAGNHVKFEHDYRKIAQLASIPGHDDSKVDIRPLVCDWLEKTESGDWILVLDNADSLIDFFSDSTAHNGVDTGLANFIPNGSKGTVLVTTRDEVVALRLCDSQVLPKEVMNRVDAISLFKNLYPKVTETPAQHLDDLLQEISYLPLAIAQAASYLRENRLITLTKYLKQFQSTKKERLRLLSKPFVDSRRHPNSSNLETVLTTFIISFQQIEEQSPLAGSLLRVMACINRQGMPVKLFESVKRPNGNETVEEALGRLISFSLLTLNRDSAVEMHAFIHLSAQEFLFARRELKTAVETTAALLVHTLPAGDIHQHISMWREYLPHASALVKLLEELKLRQEDNSSVRGYLSDGSQVIDIENYSDENVGMALADFYVIYDRLGLYYLYAGQYTNAERSTSHAYEISTSLNGKEHQDTLNSMTNLAFTFWKQGRWKEAEELGVWVMEARKRDLGEEHLETLSSMANLAATYRNQGRWKEAEGLEVPVMEARKKVLGEEHPNTLTSMGNLASTFWNQGRLKEAEDLEARVMETRKRVLGEEHPKTLISMANLAATYRNQGRWKEAEDLEVPVMETITRVLGEEHPETLSSMANLAATYRNQGRWKESEDLEVRVMEARKKVLGEEHPETLTSMANLASTYRNQGRLKEAEDLEVRVMEARKRVLGEEHPETLTSMANLASTFWNQGRLKEAEDLEVQVMEAKKRVLGEEHPNTLTSMANLAATYRNQGRWKEAENLEVRVTEARKKVLGEEHPETLTSMTNLAATYRNQGRWKEAEDLEVLVMETKKRVLGEEHPETLTSMANLAAIFWNQGRLKEAEDLEVRVMEARKKVLGEEHPKTLISMANLASTYRNQGRLKETEDLEVRVMEARKRVLGEEHPEALTSMANLAATFWNQGRLKEAEDLEVQVVEARKKVLGEEHPKTLISMANLASTYRNQGRWKETEHLEVQVMEARKRVLGEEHPNTLTSMANLASTYRDQGRWKETEDLEVRVMEARKRVLGEEHPETLTSMANMAATFWNLGRLKEAEELGVRVMEARKKVLGEEHPNTLTSMGNLAATYRNQGRWKEAEDLEVLVMETITRVLGEEHPETLTSMGNLAATYRNQGRLKEAEDLEVRVMEARKKVLGEEHPNTLTSMTNLASTYRDQGRLKEAEDLEVRVMDARKRVLGEEHPETLTSMANLASTYRNQGRLKEAEDLEMSVMEARKRVLGEEHPETLTSMANLASTFWNQGRLKEAEDLEVQVMEARKRVLGEEHPNTLTSMANLAFTYRDQGRLQETEHLEVQVMEARKRVLGEEHPSTLTSMANLAHTLVNQQTGNGAASENARGILPGNSVLDGTTY